jgi:integrase
MTDAAVQRTTAESGQRIDYFDAHPRDRQRGLVLRVSGTLGRDGQTKVSRSWAVLCRLKGSRKLRRFTIGDYPSVTLSDARDQAAKIVREARRDGADPLRERKDAERQAELASKDTIDKVVEVFMAELQKRPKKGGGKRSPRYIEETQRNFDNHVLPRWRGRQIRDITRRDIGALLRGVADEGSKLKDQDGKRRTVPGGPIASNRVLASIKALFNWAVDDGILDSSPVARIRPLGDEVPRERALTADELRELWPQFEALSYPFGPFLQLALLTGQRRDEVAGMRWNAVDLDAKTWSLDADETKPGRAHVVPLSDLAVYILKQMPRKMISMDDGSLKPGPFVFTTEGDVPISGFSAAKRRLDQRIANAQNHTGADPLERWTIHDLRRTASTEMGRVGVSEFIIGRVLNHAAKGVTGKVYNKYEYLDEKRDALDRLARHLEILIRPAPDDVVPVGMQGEPRCSSRLKHGRPSRPTVSKHASAGR